MTRVVEPRMGQLVLVLVLVLVHKTVVGRRVQVAQEARPQPRLQPYPAQWQHLSVNQAAPRARREVLPWVPKLVVLLTQVQVVGLGAVCLLFLRRRTTLCLMTAPMPCWPTWNVTRFGRRSSRLQRLPLQGQLALEVPVEAAVVLLVATVPQSPSRWTV